MIFKNPAGAPELACDACGCRWFDRQTNSCYQCGAPVPEGEMDSYSKALADFHARAGIVVNAPSQERK